ncbi:MAG: DUF4255 domain-containing protein [Pseudomonadota bacterium]
MSNVLAIAAVTQLLKDLLNDTLINGEAEQALGAEFTVTALPPDRVVAENAADQRAQLNLFLHRVTPNAALRNADLPTRTRDGTLRLRPQLAIDLHYILTAVAADELHAEILLGYAMQLFHELPLLPRETIRAALNAAVIDTVLPEDFDVLRASEIADQMELLKITPRTLSMDDMSKMWTALQASYRTTVAYDVSVVLIERNQPTRPTLPVLARGGIDDPGVNLRADVRASVPTLTSIAAADGNPVMRLGGQVVLSGYAFDIGDPVVVFREAGSGVELLMQPLSPSRPDRIIVQMPGVSLLAPTNLNAGTPLDPALWRIGSYFVEARFPQGGGREVISNTLPIALAPAISASASTLGTSTVTVECLPPIRPGQSVAILVGTQMEVIASPEDPTVQVEADFDGLVAGQEVPVRLRVDGIDSPIIDRSGARPRYETVTVT